MTPITPRRLAAVALLVGLVAVHRAAGQTPDDAKASLAAFADERAAALKAKYPPQTLLRADESAKRAEAALKAGDAKAATRHARDARWQVPYLPPGLPAHVVRVLGESRLRHADRVNAVGYSPDGSHLVTASRDGTAKVWDLANGREVVSYRGHLDAPAKGGTEANVFRVADAAFAPDGKLVATAGGNEIHLWNPADGTRAKVITRTDAADKPFKALAWSPDGKSLAAGGDDQVLRVYSVETGKATYTSPQQANRIEGVAFAPNGKLVGTVNNGGQLTVYAPGASNPIALGIPVGDSGEAYDVAFTADSGAVLTAGRDGKVRLTAGPNADGSSGGKTATPLREFVGHTEAVRSLAVSKDGVTAVSGGADKTVRVWDVASGRQVRTFQGHLSEVMAVALRPDGRQVASAGDDGTIRLWDLAPADDHKAMTDAADSVWAVAVSPDGKRVAAAGADKTVRVYAAATGQLERALPAAGGAVTAVVFLDADHVAAAGGDRVVRVVDVSSGKVVKELPGHESAVLALAGSTDGKLLVSGAADRTVRGWDVESGKAAWTWTGKSAVCAVAVRKDGKVVAVGGADGGLVTLDVAGPSPKDVHAVTAHLAGVAGVAFDADGARLVTGGGDGSVRVWAVSETGVPSALARFDGPIRPGAAGGYSPVSAVAFGPDGRLVASCGADQTVHLWDVQTKSEARGLRGHTDWATAVVFAPDGRSVVSAGVDKAVRVWELSPQETAPAPGHTQTVRAVAVSPDGRYAATASTDKTVKVWDLADGREVSTLLGAAEKVYTVSFLGADRLVTGGELPAGDAGRVQFWAVKPPRMEKGVATGRAWAVVGSADGSKVAAWTTKPAVGDASNHTYELFDASGALVTTLAETGRDVQAATFTPDLSRVASGDKTGTVRLWGLAKKEKLGADWPLFTRPVADLALTPDKTRLVAIDTASDEKGQVKPGVVKVGDVAKREVLGSAEAHKGGINGLLVSPKGDTFVTVGVDGEVKAWSVAGVKEIRSWKCPVTVWGAAYTPDGTRVVTANGDGTAYVLELPRDAN